MLTVRNKRAKVLDDFNTLERSLGPLLARTSTTRAGGVLVRDAGEGLVKVLVDVYWWLGHCER